jgi:hypothetical protein
VTSDPAIATRQVLPQVIASARNEWSHATASPVEARLAELAADDGPAVAELGFEEVRCDGASARDLRARWTGSWALWRDQLAVRKALVKFDALGGADEDRAISQERIVRASLIAARYDLGKDPGEMHRSRMVVERSRLPSLATAARVLANACDRRDYALVLAMGDDAPDVFGNDMASQLGSRLRALARNLEGPLPQVHECAHWRHHCIGNLRYTKPIMAGQRVDVATMLAFELAVCLRNLTAGSVGADVCAPMPKHGKPCVALVAEFVNAALGTDLTGHHVKYRLSGLPGDVWLAGWPDAGG